MLPSVSNQVSPAQPESHPRRSGWIRWGISILLLGLLIYFFWPMVGEIKEAAFLFRRAHWLWFGVALAVQVCSYSSLTWLNVLALRPFSGRIGFLQLTAVLTAMAFIAVAVPSAGLSGVALRVHLLRKYKYLPEESLFSLMVETMLELIALATVALVGILYLVRRGRISDGSFMYAILAGVCTLVVFWYFWRLINNYSRSRRLLGWLVGRWNRLAGRFKRFDLEYLNDRLRFFQRNLKRYDLPILIKLPLSAYGKAILDVITMGLCFRLFGYEISPSLLFIGYGLVLTFSGLTALPGGLVMTDAFVPIIFSWLRVPGSVAIAAGLSYRLIAFWLVRFVGYLCWLWLEKRK